MHRESGAGESDVAKGRLVQRDGRPLFHTKWPHTVFLHFSVDPRLLQPAVPVPLDHHEGETYVSVVAFQQRNFVFAPAPRLASWLTASIGSHDFCNMRTYVRYQDEPAVFFLTEWMPKPLAAALARNLYGLPYQTAQLNYSFDSQSNRFDGQVRAPSGSQLCLEASLRREATAGRAEQGTLEDFLVERYTGLTYLRRRQLLFRIWHHPWRLRQVDACVREDTLLHETFSWYRSARFVGAHHAASVDPVWIGRPRRT